MKPGSKTHKKIKIHPEPNQIWVWRGPSEIGEVIIISCTESKINYLGLFGMHTMDKREFLDKFAIKE